MLLLQILIIPIVVFLLLGAVFIIGSIGLELPGYISREHHPADETNEAEPTQNDTISLPIIPILKI